jgi:serine/threonine protein kinase
MKIKKKDQIWKFYSLIGKGVSSKCYLSENQESHEFSVIKTIKHNSSIESKKSWIKHIINEFAIASILDHPNIVHTFDIILKEHIAYEVTELCPNGDLFSFIQKHKIIPLDEIHKIFQQLLHGVEYLHKNGICHRDLKPENCMFDKDKNLKIIDFGCAKVIKPPFSTIIQSCSSKSGTIPYMAPEEFENIEYNGFAVDIWSCAIIYLVLKNHKLPWEISTVDDIFFQLYIRNNTIFGKKQQPFIHEMLEKNFNKRIDIKTLIFQFSVFTNMFDGTLPFIEPLPNGVL